jgi:hypothetical protein
MDHLGIQVIGEQIYSDLLPGITNVTDRLWNYAFYPWFAWAYEKEGMPEEGDAFAEALRRAEVLNTLVAAVHEWENGEDPFLHGGGLVGRQKLLGAARQIVDGDVISLEEFAPVDAPRQYFANRRGGLGQYYLGALRGLKLLQWDAKSGAQISDSRGAHLAEAFDGCVNRARFFECLKSPNLDLERARELASFCPCHLNGMRGVRDLLEDLLLNRAGGLFHEEEGDRRRQTMLLLLASAAHASGAETSIDTQLASWNFREAAYSGVWLDGSPLFLPEGFQKTLVHWRGYQRHELMSVALQGIFWAGLFSLAGGAQEVASPTAYADWFIARFGAVLNNLGPLTTSMEQVKTRHCLELPSLEDFENPEHELALAHGLLGFAQNGEADECVVGALKVLLRLYGRSDGRDPYESFPFAPDYFRDYPLNLKSLFDIADPSQTFGDWIRRLVLDWGIAAHLRVAFRKLHREGLDTFKIRPGEDRYWCLGQGEIPPPTWTTPRLSQAVRMLFDLGLLDRDLLPTDAGRSMLIEEGLLA